MSYDPHERRQTPLAVRLRQTIAKNGPVTVADFMSACLWDEHAGYYATRHVIGRQGDFITASEISQVFGELVGLWAGVVWQQVLGSPAQLTLCEYGPGRGTMMRDVLRAARVVPNFAPALHVHLVEASPTLQELQRQTLQGCNVPISWGHNLASFPAPAIIVANEFLDAWPLQQWIRTQEGWAERGVDLDARGGLVFCEMNSIDAAAAHRLEARYPGAEVGAIVEAQAYGRFAHALQKLAQSGPFAALVIDYGYATASAGDTLQAVREHRYEHPLTSPGEADLSAHVSFYDLASELHASGLAIDGPVTQAEFLGALGIIERASRLMHANPARAGEIEMGVARLMAPQGMGVRFKVMGVRSQDLPPLPGFAPPP